MEGLILPDQATYNSLWFAFEAGAFTPSLSFTLLVEAVVCRNAVSSWRSKQLNRASEAADDRM